MVWSVTRRKVLAMLGGATAAVGAAVTELAPSVAPPRVPGPMAPAGGPVEAVALPAATVWTPHATGFTIADDVAHQIKAYASATSVGRGESVDFHVSVSPTQPFRVQVFRLGHPTSGAPSAQLMTASPALDGVPGKPAAAVGPTRAVTCDWPVAWRLQVPTAWRSGYYVAVFTTADRHRNCAVFLVRDDGAPKDLLLVLPFTTFQAYNIYPNDGRVGASLYNAFDQHGRMNEDASTAVSFDRPFQDDGLPDLFDIDSSFVFWAESQPYSLSYATSIDLHAGRVDPRLYKAMVFTGHDEYWSPEIRHRLEAAIDGGTSVAFMAANNVYWTIRFASSAAGAPHRTVVCYKNNPDPGPGPRTTLWRHSRPEQQTIGSQYLSMVADAAPRPLVVSRADHWFWKGTGVRNGERIPNMIGGEADQVMPGYGGPPVDRVATSPYTMDSGGRLVRATQHSIVRQAHSGAWVFDAGTYNWNLGLAHPGYVDKRIQQATRNLLDRMVHRA